jgi:hypothetical protein
VGSDTQQVLVAFLIVTTVFCLLSVSALLWIRASMRRHMRVRPSTKSPAPTGWALSTSEPARLHRRLRRIAASARVAGTNTDLTTAAVAVEVEDEAVRLERCLVVLSGVWRTERDARKDLAAQITELEHLTARLVTSAAARSNQAALESGTVNSLTQIRERLDALDAARTEVSIVEQQSGLRYG